MKARVSASKKQLDELIMKVEQEVYDDAVRACEDNNAMFILALNNEFDFGPVRIKRLIAAFNKAASQTMEMKKDGFTKDEIHESLCKQLESIGVDPAAVYSDQKDFQQVIRNKKKAEIPDKPSRAEAKAVFEHMTAFRNFIADNTGDTAAN